METYFFDSEEMWRKETVDFIVSRVTKVLKNQKEFRLALSGGSTPKPIYAALAEEKLPFAQLHLYQADERYVSKESPELNANMIQETLAYRLPEANKHFFNTALSIVQAKQNYENILLETGSPLFHVAILGIGPDGHTASLFPHSAALMSDRLAEHTETDNFPGHDRLTLTPRAILQSESILILVNDPKKVSLIERFINAKENMGELPILFVKNHPRVFLYCRK